MEVLPPGVPGMVCGRRPPSPRAPFLFVTPGPLSVALAVEAASSGAVDALSFEDGDAAERLVRGIALLSAPETPVPTEARLVFKSAAGHALAQQLARAAQTSMPVLLVGETGTGKEVAAHLVHSWSSRAKHPFVAINCAAIPDELMEAELFGYTRGSFSGATHDYNGRLSHAEGGTVFLDEVDDTPLGFQVKLLRVLEDRIVSRLGEDAAHAVDFRLIAATNRDLHALMASGAFGTDLYERLAIVTIELPSLRDRVEDIPLLVQGLLRRFYEEEPAARQRHHVVSVAPHTMAVLQAAPWPGNIRELRNTIYASLVHKRSGEELVLSDLPRRILEQTSRPAPSSPVDPRQVEALIDREAFDLVTAVDDLERIAVAHALQRSEGNAAAAARLLGRVGRGAARDPGSTVRAMATRLGIGDHVRRR